MNLLHLWWRRRWRLLCYIGGHEWDYPGGHCVDCGKCDHFFGKHVHSDDLALRRSLEGFWKRNPPPWGPK